MIKIIITTLFIASTYSYPYEGEREIDPPVEAPVPGIKPLNPELSNEVPNFDAGAAPANVKPGPEGSDLKTDATFWPFYRSYNSYPYSYYSYPYYTYYTPRVYYRYNYW